MDEVEKVLRGVVLGGPVRGNELRYEVDRSDDSFREEDQAGNRDEDSRGADCW